MALEDKINSAIRILKLAEKEAQQYNEPVEIAYSGGKDSDVLLQLAKESGINYRAIYKNTTIDPPGTMQHVKSKNVEIIKPKKSFFELIKQKGYPSMFRRFCCQELKEYKILNVACLGVRAEESPKRKQRYKSFEICRIFRKKQKVRQYFPLLDWTLNDVINYIVSRKIQLAPHYYENGKINYYKRLGCLGCPLKKDRGLSDFLNNKAILKAWLKSGIKYCKDHPKALKNFNNNAFEAFYCAVFCRSIDEYYLNKSNNLFGEGINPKRYIEDFFNIKIN